MPTSAVSFIAKASMRSPAAPKPSSSRPPRSTRGFSPSPQGKPASGLSERRSKSAHRAQAASAWPARLPSRAAAAVSASNSARHRRMLSASSPAQSHREACAAAPGQREIVSAGSVSLPGACASISRSRAYCAYSASVRSDSSVRPVSSSVTAVSPGQSPASAVHSTAWATRQPAPPISQSQRRMPSPSPLLKKRGSRHGRASARSFTVQS